MINLITISAPSGSGKTTLCKALQKVKPEIEWSVSYTTREIRSTEVNTEDYNFISQDKFENLIIKQELAEWENVHGFYYGTSKNKIEDAISKNKIMLLEMDVKGAIRIKELYYNNTFSIFIEPPGFDIPEKKLVLALNGTVKRKWGKKEEVWLNYFGDSYTVRGWALPNQKLYNSRDEWVGWKFRSSLRDTSMVCSEEIFSDESSLDYQELFIPNAFSPDNDGINDFWFIKGLSKFPNNRVIIYSRWEMKVLDQGPYLNDWNGEQRVGNNLGSDANLPEGTYFYILDLGDGQAARKGFIYLRRRQ